MTANERRRGPDPAEHLAVGAAHLLPPGDVGHVQARADHILERGARLREGALDVPQRLPAWA